MLRGNSRIQPLLVLDNGHEFGRQLPETDKQRERSKFHINHWLYCDYRHFLEYLEAREKELGINHNR